MTASTARPNRALAALACVAASLLLLAGVQAAAADLTSLAQWLAYAAVGGFLAIRRPGNVIGWLLIAIGFASAGTSTPPWLDVAALQAGTAPPLHLVWAWASIWAGGASFLLYAAVAMVFPSGHVPRGRWRAACLPH